MGRRDKGKKKAVAQGSDVFTMFEKTQLQEFKEAFEMIDSNRDGFIDKNDLKSTWVKFPTTPGQSFPPAVQRYLILK